jgi:DNA-binding NarL/FixJ family response regulator
MRILIADDDAEVRSALHILLKHQPDTTVVGEAATALELAELIETQQPDALIVDWGLIDRTPRLVAGWHVIVISGQSGVQSAALAAGAEAFVSKSDPPERLLAALQRMNDSHTSHHDERTDP